MYKFEQAQVAYAEIAERVQRVSPEEISVELSDIELLSSGAICHGRMGQFSKAISIQKSVVAAWQRRKGGEHPSTIKSIGLLVLLYHIAGHHKQATESGEHLFPLMKRLLGIHDLLTLTTAEVLAQGYFELDQRSSSLVMYEWLAEICLSCPVDQKILVTLHRVTWGFFELGLKEKTKSLTTSLVAMSQDILAQEHPQTRR